MCSQVQAGHTEMGNGHESPQLPATSAGSPAEGAAGMDAFFRQQRQPLVAFLHRRSQTVDDAEDAAQESFVRFIPYVHRQPPKAWKPTLYRIAINVVNDRLRRARARYAHQHVPLEGLEVPCDQPSLEEAVARTQQQVQLREAILALPPQCRQICLLKLVNGMENPEIARHCGISVRMVEKHLGNALLHLRRRFGRAVPGTY